MFTCECIFRKDEESLELTIGVRYKAINIDKENDTILVINNLGDVVWYPAYYFKII